MAPRFLLDTSALLAHHRQEPGWARVQAILEDTDSHVLVASVSLPELARRLPELGATSEEARRIVEDETPQRLPLTDALIAAAARERSACLVHRDRHMVPIPPSVAEQLDLSLVPDS